jgi:tripartite-type tricarboxylate transporter receptor subunit TctC
MKLPRRRFLQLAASAAGLPAVSRMARAQSYPARPVHMISSFAAGGPNDLLARLIGQWLSERLGEPFIIDNRPGAGGNIGAEVAAKAAPDGYTLLMVAPANVVNVTLYDKLEFNFMRDIAPVGGLTRVPEVMEVNPSFPAKTVPEFIAYAKVNPGKINMASGGNGSAAHVAGELFKIMTGIEMVHVAYRGLAHRPPGRSGPGHIRQRAQFDRPYPGRSAASARHHHRHAAGGAAGYPDRERNRPGLRGERVGGRRRTPQHPG